eukprot:TRINITY_DN1251_c0_g1_i2.p1 TRINITY_DN1251_c0_g1~~TRINITY_DN1251_c0_g1_i2.p1  ORF type:complete len:651 (-),score=129.41 TRINITY_DN1251_c0_g1_i2:48-2000(-)
MPGRYGNTGCDGRDGQPGKVLWVVKNDIGLEIERSHNLYHPIITGFSVVPIIDDGILEPSEEVMISNISIKNEGGLHLPAGTTISIRGSENFHRNDDSIIIPHPVAPQQEVILYGELRGRIGPSTGLSSFDLVFELLGSTFSEVATWEDHNIQYPLYLAVEDCIQIPYGDHEVSFGVNNISHMVYGTDENNVRCEFTVSNGLEHKNEADRVHGVELTGLDPHSLFDDILQVVVLEKNSLYSQLKVTIDLYLRDILIENATINIQVVPLYLPRSSDVLLVTNESMGKNTFMAFDEIFTKFALEYDIWDYKYNGGFDNLKRYFADYTSKLIVIYNGSYDIFQYLDMNDLSQHFSNSENGGSGVLVVGSINEDTAEHIFSSMHVYKELSAEETSDSFYINNPTISDMENKMAHIVADRSDVEPSYKWDCNINFEPKTIKKGWTSTLISYGDGRLLRSNISLIDKVVGNTFKDVRSLLWDRIHSAFGILWVSILCALPIQKRVDIILRAEIITDKLLDIQSTIYEIIECSIYMDIKNQFFLRDQENCSLLFDLLTLYNNNPGIYINEIYIELCLRILYRLSNGTWWHSFTGYMYTRFSTIEKMINEFIEGISDRADRSINIEELRESAELLGPSKNRVKWEQIQTNGQPFRFSL